jgi:hypothetical protein
VICFCDISAWTSGVDMVPFFGMSIYNIRLTNLKYFDPIYGTFLSCRTGSIGVPPPSPPPKKKHTALSLVNTSYGVSIPWKFVITLLSTAMSWIVYYSCTDFWLQRYTAVTVQL